MSHFHDNVDRLTEFPDDPFDRHFLIGKPTVSPGISASSARTAKNTTPATTAMLPGHEDSDIMVK
jgi:hypothetical protein